jgi:hypothetical protein
MAAVILVVLRFGDQKGSVMWMVEVDLERTDSWTPLCGHNQQERAES